MIEVDNLQHCFGDFLLQNITLRVPRGDYAVILGPSGCGKSVLLRTLAGLSLPESGTIRIGGRDVTTKAPEDRAIGMVFQEPSLFPHLGVAANIAYGLRVQGTKPNERKARVEELASVLKLTGLLGRRVTSLSGGEAQRVVLARALAVRPEVLLLDEPLSQLDHNARLSLQQELRRVHDELGITTLHVTHSRDEARALGDLCAVMLGGRIVQAGRRDDVEGKPACSFVAGFLGIEDAEPERPPGCTQACLVGTGVCDRSGEDED